jgi:hypothetical protein
MDGRQELFAYLGSAIITIAGLFGLQYWYATYLDVAVVHASRADTPLNEKVAAVRAAEQQKLSSGAMPIDQAKRGLAQRGRAAFPKIAPKPSDDLSAMSGWMYQPGFKTYEPRTPPPPPAEQAIAAADGAAAAPAGEGAAPGTEAPKTEARP